MSENAKREFVFRWGIKNGDIHDVELGRRLVSVSFQCYPLFEQRRAALDLIAAAPDMLAALRACVGFLDDGTPESERSPLEASTLRTARAAIAKAEGTA